MSSCDANDPDLQYPTTAESQGWVWQKGIFQSDDLIGFFGVPIILLCLSTICFIWNARSNSTREDTDVGKSDDDDNRSKEKTNYDGFEILHFRSIAGRVKLAISLSSLSSRHCLEHGSCLCQGSRTRHTCSVL